MYQKVQHKILTVAVILGLAAAAIWTWPRPGATPEEMAALEEGRTIITHWDRHSGHEHDMRVALFDEFNASQDEIYVRAVTIGYNATMEKILTSTAGGAPPDLVSLESSMMHQLVGQGLFLPLDDLYAATPALAASDFFPHAWDMVHFDDHTWAIPTTMDVYCLLWNKQAFREAGLDPEVPPETIAELEAYAAKLTKRGPDGKIERVGFVPWMPWDLSFMWGGIFGGDWYNEETGLVELASDKALIASYAWQESFTRPAGDMSRPWALDEEEIAYFSEGARNYMSANNAFYAGKVAMITEGEWQVTFISRYAPGLEWGVAALPHPAGQPSRGYGPAAVVDVIPVTAREPEAARKFMQWYYSPRSDGRPSPASDYCYAIHNIPPRKSEAMQERFMGHPKFRVWVEQLLTKEIVTFPIHPAAQYMLDQIERQRESVIHHSTTPEEAVAEVERLTNKDLLRIRGTAERRGE